MISFKILNILKIFFWRDWIFLRLFEFFNIYIYIYLINIIYIALKIWDGKYICAFYFVPTICVSPWCLPTLCSKVQCLAQRLELILKRTTAMEQLISWHNLKGRREKMKNSLCCFFLLFKIIIIVDQSWYSFPLITSECIKVKKITSYLNSLCKRCKDVYFFCDPNRNKRCKEF